MEQKIYHSTHKQLGLTFFKGTPERTRIQFTDHTFVTSDEKIITAMDEMIANWEAKEMHKSQWDFMSLDDKEIMEASEPKFIVVDGEKVNTSELKNAVKDKGKLIDENEELKKQIVELKKIINE